MGKYLMCCGHVSNAVTSDGKPCCVICSAFVPNEIAFLIDREIVNDTDGLEGRQAECSWCGKKVQSKWTLPFFEHRPYKPTDGYYCGCGGWD